MSCPEITIPNIDAQLYATLEKQALAAGATFNGCTAKIRSLTFIWTYNAESQTLTATCTEKPIYVSCSIVASHLQNLVAQAKLTQLREQPAQPAPQTPKEI